MFGVPFFLLLMTFFETTVGAGTLDRAVDSLLDSIDETRNCAQPYVLKGRVLDQKLRPVEGVEVKLSDQNRVLGKTDSGGRYRIAVPHNGKSLVSRRLQFTKKGLGKRVAKPFTARELELESQRCQKIQILRKVMMW